LLNSYITLPKNQSIKTESPKKKKFISFLWF